MRYTSQTVHPHVCRRIRLRYAVRKLDRLLRSNPLGWVERREQGPPDLPKGGGDEYVAQEHGVLVGIRRFEMSWQIGVCPDVEARSRRVIDLTSPSLPVLGSP